MQQLWFMGKIYPCGLPSFSLILMIFLKKIDFKINLKPCINLKFIISRFFLKIFMTTVSTTMAWIMFLKHWRKNPRIIPKLFRKSHLFRGWAKRPLLLIWFIFIFINSFNVEPIFRAGNYLLTTWFKSTIELFGNIMLSFWNTLGWLMQGKWFAR